MRRPIVTLLLVLTASACDSGPLPELPATDADVRADWFPSESAKPYPLDDAIYKGNFEDLRSLLNAGANPNRRWGQSGDHFALQVLLDHGGSPRIQPIETARLLLQHGADPNARWCPFQTRDSWRRPRCTSAKGVTPLMFAAAAGEPGLVELLLAAGADPDAKDWMAGSPLRYAKGATTFELISRALFPDFRSRDRQALSYLGERPLSHALTENYHYLPGRAVPALANDYEAYVAYYGNAREERITERAITLLRLSADPDELVELGGERVPALIHALVLERMRLAHALLEHGADVNARACFGDDRACRPASGTTALMWAAAAGHTAAVELLLDYRADVSLMDSRGRTAAHVARDSDIQGLILGARR